MAYLYRHIRLDNNTPFYIGYGGTGEFDKYRRAYTRSKRSASWKNVVNKSAYRVEIILDNIPNNEIKEKEIEFVKLYGRKDINEGTLVNLTDGGDGCNGVKQSKEWIEKKSKFPKGYKPWNTGLVGIIKHPNRSRLSEQHKNDKRNVKSLSYEIEQYDKFDNLINTYPSLMEAHRQTGISRASLGSYIRDVSLNKDEYRFIIKGTPLFKYRPKEYKKLTEEHKYNIRRNSINKGVVKYGANGGIVRFYFNKTECGKDNRIGIKKVNEIIKNKIKVDYILKELRYKP